jgi:two-component system sensor histidine kinase CpxA
MIALTIGAAAAVGIYYSERTHAAMERFEVSDSIYEASAALRRDGRDGLVDWLNSLPRVTESLIYVVDERGRDVLHRRLPASISLAFRRFGGRRLPGGSRDAGNVRPARPFTELVSPDGSLYTVFILQPQGRLDRWVADRSLSGLIVLAILVSAAFSFLLARTISQPVRQLRNSATAIAAGRLDTRVAKGVVKRRDEIGLLAREFDRMAGELERSLRRQTELTRNVSHELRSPLARLRVALELARRKAGELPELEKIDTETGKLDALIGQILEFSKLDEHDLEQSTQLNLVDLVHSIVDDVRFEYGDNIDVELQYQEDDDVFVDGYESALRACVENVLRNAARHGAPKSKITVELTEQDNGAMIVIQDDGGGVAPSELDSLFEPFFRAAPNSAEAARRGKGLGLAIAKRAIELHAGSISAINQDGGLRVTITLPGG